MALSLLIQEIDDVEAQGFPAAPRRRDASGSDCRRVVPALRLGTSWQTLHGLFTGTAWGGPAPANLLIHGGRAIQSRERTGDTRLVSSPETARFAAFVSPICQRALRSRIDPHKVRRTRFYLADSGDCPSREELGDEVERDFPLLQRYVRDAAGRGNGLMLYMAAALDHR